jgi:hypothetical protein
LVLKPSVEIAFRTAFIAPSTTEIEVNMCVNFLEPCNHPIFLRLIKAQESKMDISREIKRRCRTESALKDQYAHGSDRGRDQNINMVLIHKKNGRVKSNW